MKNYVNGLSFFLKKNGVIGSKTYFLKIFEENKNIKSLKSILSDCLINTNPTSILK
jgi:hypothetical protein